MTMGLQRRCVNGTQRSYALVKADISGRQSTAWVERDNGFLKSVFVEQESKIIKAVKCGIRREGAVMKRLEVQQNGLERGGVPDFLI